MGHFDGCNFEHVKQFRIEGNKKKTYMKYFRFAEN